MAEDMESPARLSPFTAAQALWRVHSRNLSSILHQLWLLKWMSPILPPEVANLEEWRDREELLDLHSAKGNSAIPPELVQGSIRGPGPSDRGL